MSGRRSRFLNLEMGRKEAPGGAAPTDPGRFDALEQPAAAPVASSSPSVDRFRPPVEQQASLELSQSRPEDQPFIRCMRCEADNHALATFCAQCHNDLNTADQRQFNEKLWAQRRQEAAALQEQEEKFKQQKLAADVPVPDQRALGEAIAATVARETRQRMEREESQSFWTGHGSLGRFRHRPDLLSTLLGLLPEKVLRVLFYGALTLGVVLSVIPSTRKAGLVLMVLVGAIWLQLWLKS